MTVEEGHDGDMSQQLVPGQVSKEADVLPGCRPRVCAALGCISDGEPGDILLMKTPNQVNEDPFHCQPDHTFPKSESS